MKELVKRILSVALAACMIAVLFTGCSGDKGDSNPTDNAAVTTTDKPTETAASDVTLRIYQGKGEIVDAFAAMCDEYTAETGVKIDIYATATDATGLLQSYMSSDEMPAIFTISPGVPFTTYADYLADLSDLQCAGEIYDNMLQKNDAGAVVGIPFSVEGFGLVYNGNMATADDLSTMDSLVSYIETNGTASLTLSSESYFLIVHMLSTAFSLQDDPEAFTNDLINGDVTLAGNQAFEDFATLYAAIRDNCENPMSVSYDGACGNLATGVVAMIHQGNWCISMFDSYDVSGVDFEMAPLPLAGNDGLMVGVPNCWCVNSQVSAEEQQAAKDFIDWMYTSDTGKDYLYNQFNFVPLIDADVSSVELDALSAKMMEYVSAGKTIAWSTYYNPNGIADDLTAVAESFFTGTETTAELLEAIQTAYQGYAS